jgi:acyl-CoA synthetase (AMP-forming)/AMP-acid ligase II
VIEHLRAAWDELTAPGAGFAMTAVEARGIPMHVFTNAPPTMRALWELATSHGDKPYLVYEDERFTYAEVAAQVRSLAHRLRDEHGVGSGDRVALAMRNYPEWVVGYWAVVSLGASVVGLNAWWTTPELEYGLGDSRPKVLIADDERLDRVLPVLDDLRSVAPLHVISVRTDRALPADASRWSDVVDPVNAPADLPPADIDPDDDATIFYTSGTTGFPKGAQLTHRGSVTNVFDLVFMVMAIGLADAKAVAAGDRPPAPPAGVASPSFMAATPLFHVTACNCVLHPCTLAGGKVVLMRKWDAGRALELIEREAVTNFSGVPTMSRELLAHPDWATRDTSTLRSVVGGGAPVQPDLVEKIDASLSGTGGRPATGYGLTETHGVVSVNGARVYLDKPQSCGLVVPALDVKLVDPMGETIPPGPDAVGELCVRGSIVIKGYLNRPEATAEAIRDGWFHTGDIARLDDDGFLYIVDRAKDMVLRGGENVYCAEVEAAIHQIDDVAEVAVFGVPDERLGEAVAAVVVRRAGSTLTADDITAHLDGLIARHKIPSTLRVQDEPLPRNANGKFLKRQLRDDVVMAVGHEAGSPGLLTAEVTP